MFSERFYLFKILIRLGLKLWIIITTPVSDTSYDYAVPELGTMPLLSPENTPPVPASIQDKEPMFPRTTVRSIKDECKGKKVTHLKYEQKNS